MTTEFFVGPAVVVDDKIDQPESGMVSVLAQIAAEGMPIVTRTELPPDVEIDHWRGFALIILDWQLNPVDPDTSGLALPGELSEQNTIELTDFVAELLKRLYCPIFILTNESVDVIHEELATRVDVDSAQIEARILVRAKAAVEDSLFEELDEWVRTHPAVYAFKCWEGGYEDARRVMFADFELASSWWPRILWKTSAEDGVNESFELTETLSRNILHRFEPLVFDRSVLEAEGEGDGDGDSIPPLRRVIHRSAVVDESALHADVIMPGDFFQADPADSQRSKILINVTPACNLVPHAGGAMDTIKMTLLEGNLVDVSEFNTDDRRKKLLRPRHEDQVIWVLRDDALPYRISFKKWHVDEWGVHKGARVGRLLEPHITLLQQRFALYFQRQGVPRLPDNYYPQGGS